MHTKFIRPAIFAAALSAIAFTGSSAFAEMASYKAELKGAQEVPSNDSKGVGAVEASFDTATKKLAWTITYSGLTGTATAAHFHGPAAATANAPPVVPIAGELKSPIKGEAVLTEAQAGDLQGGRWYFNIHTAAHKDGEIRGQVVKK